LPDCPDSWSPHPAGAQDLDAESSDFGTWITTLDKSSSCARYCRSEDRSKTAMTAMLKADFGQAFQMIGGGIATRTANGSKVTVRSALNPVNAAIE
jgi:rhodanese-related sulfurtransferase